MSPSGLPPEAIEYQESHLYQNYTRNIGGLYIVLVVLAFLSMILRVVSRRLTKARLEADDWTFLAGAVCKDHIIVAWSVLMAMADYRRRVVCRVSNLRYVVHLPP